MADKKSFEQVHHEDLVSRLSWDFGPIMRHSDQGVCVFLDDHHKACNQKMASMLGYKSPKDWGALDKDFLETFVDEKSRRAMESNYQKMADNFVATVAPVTWKMKSGRRIKTKVIQVPVAFEGHLAVLMFVSK